MNEIVHTNCIDGMKSIPAESVPMTLTSPPYGRLREYGGVSYGWDDFTAIARELTRITMKGGVIVWIVQNVIEKGREIIQSEKEKVFFVEKCGLWAYQTIIATATSAPMAPRRRYASQYTHNVYVFSKGKPRYVHRLRDKKNKRAGEIKDARLERRGDIAEYVARETAIAPYGYRSNVWVQNVGGVHTSTEKFTRAHPARMTEGLAEDLIVSYSRPNDLVFDPMCGSGTTCKMALLNYRRYLGMEINAEYVKMARRRMRIAERTLDSRLLSRAS
jgi:DNA modification methylase